MREDQGSVVKARPAATVLIARDAEQGIEILLAQRSPELRFMGGAYVFPGGAVHSSDHTVLVAERVQVAAAAWPGQPDLDADRAHALAAIRETLEEVGLLIGTEAASPLELRGLRARLEAGLDFASALAEFNVSLDLSQLVPLIRWITPASEPIRFDTRFFVARAPDNQAPEVDGRETVSLVWLSPARALAEAAQERIRLSAPTRRTLNEIARADSVQALFSLARAYAAPTVEPVIRNIDGKQIIVFPGDPEHPMQRPVLSGPTRTGF